MHHAHVAEDGQGVAHVAFSHGIRDDNQLGGICVGCLLQYLREDRKSTRLNSSHRL